MRPQVNTDLGGPEQLRTTARPLNSTAQVFQPMPSRGQELAKALSGIKPELTSYLDQIGAEYREGEEARAYDAIQGMTFEQAQEMISNGDLRATESPWYKAAFDKQFGLAYAGRRRREVVDAYQNSFDKHGGDVDAFLADFAADDVEKFGENKHIMAGVREGMSGVFGKVKDEHAQWTSETTRATASDQFIDVARNAFDRATDAGQNPMEAIQGLYGQHRDMLGLTDAEMDAAVLQIAEERAQAGDVHGARAILEHDRVGPDGKPVGSFTTRTATSLQSQRLLETAQSNQGRNLRADNTASLVGLRERASQGRLNDQDMTHIDGLAETTAISQEMRESLVLQNNTAQIAGAADAWEANVREQAVTGAADALNRGQGYLLQDAEVPNPYTGRPLLLKADEVMEAAATDQVNQMLAEGASPAVVAQHMAEWGVNYTYAPFENALSYGYRSLTEAVAHAGKDGPKIAPPAIAGYNMWKAMSNQPRLRDAHVVDATAGQVFRDAAALERIGTPVEEALLRAASIDRKSGRQSLSSSVERDRFHSTVGKAVSGGLFSSPEANAGQIANWVEESVRIQMDLGVPMREATNNALEAYRDSHETINGVAVNIRDNFIPPDFGAISEVVLEDFAKSAGLEASDITLYPSHDGSDYWLVVYKGNLAPVAAEGHTGRFHISELQQGRLKETLRDAANERIRTRRENPPRPAQSAFPRG